MSPVPEFSAKELRILDLLVEGKRNRPIAEALGTTEQVIKNKLRAIYEKSGMSNRIELAFWWKEKRTAPVPTLCQESPR